MNFKNITNNLFVTIFLASVSVQAVADGWAMFGQQEQMKNYVIADVGDVSKVEPPFNTKWEKDVYQLNGRCFLSSGYIGYWGYGTKAAFLLVNAQKNIQLALVESAIGSIKVEVQPISMIECPSGTNVIPYSADPGERLRLLKQRQEELRKKYEDLQK
jgi:hypothetical protein